MTLESWAQGNEAHPVRRGADGKGLREQYLAGGLPYSPSGSRERGGETYSSEGGPGAPPRLHRNYGTTVAFLPEFKHMEADLQQQIEKGKQAGQMHWVDKNERKLRSILPIIEVLEAGTGYSAMAKDEREYTAEERAAGAGTSAVR